MLLTMQVKEEGKIQEGMGVQSASGSGEEHFRSTVVVAVVVVAVVAESAAAVPSVRTSSDLEKKPSPPRSAPQP